MLDATNRFALHLGPVDGSIQLLVDQTDGADIVASYDIEAERYLGRRLWAVGSVDNALHCGLEDLE